jgi:competence protein ComEA
VAASSHHAGPHHDDGVGPDDAGPSRGAHVPTDLIDTAIHWLRFVGPGRLLGIIGAGLVLVGVGWWMLRSPADPTEARLPPAGGAAAAAAVTSAVSGGAASTTTSAVPATRPPAVVVHVTGAVRDPGVYELQPGQRVADAIVAAGGALAEADPDALNLAAPLADGDRIAVPVAGEAGMTGGDVAAAGHSHAGSATEGVAAGAPVNLNTASADELETLPGIGPATAAAIVEHREQNGPYASVDDLEAVRGIGPAKLDAIRDQVTV